jgi:hypothetical protein
MKFQLENLKETGRLEDLGIDRWIILNCTLKKRCELYSTGSGDSPAVSFVNMAMKVWVP